MRHSISLDYDALRALLRDCGHSQRSIAAACGVGASTINALLRGRPPKTAWPDLRRALRAALRAAGADAGRLEAALPEAPGTPNAPEPVNERPEDQTTKETTEEETMILRKQRLSMTARAQFGLTRDPFADPQSPADVYLSPETRYVREYLYDAAVNGNFLAVYGESGSGKSTLREDLIERLRGNGDPVIVIEPYTLCMASSDRLGKPLLAPHMAEAVIATVSPQSRIPQSPERRSREMHRILAESCRAGFRHCLIIEEAHDLHWQTLKALKRFWELKDGMRRLLSIILIGQTELRARLSSTQSGVREVVQRCDAVELPPVREPADYLAFRFQRAGVPLEKVFDAGALDALRESLSPAPGVWMGYPLAIANMAAACMNLAADLGFETVTADVVRQARP